MNLRLALLLLAGWAALAQQPEARQHVESARELFRSRQPRRARAELDHALEIYRKHKDHDSAGDALVQLSQVVRQTGRRAVAESMLEEAVEEFRLAGSPAGQARAYSVLIEFEPDAAIRASRLKNALEAARATGDERITGLVLRADAEASFRSGDYRTAQARYEEAATRFERAGEQRLLASVLEGFAKIAGVHGHCDTGREQLFKAMRLYQQVKDSPGEMETLLSLSHCAELTGQPKQAVEYAEQGAAVAQRTGNRRHINRANGRLATAYFEASDLRRGVELTRRVLDSGGRVGSAVQSHAGAAHVRLGEPEKAIEYLSRAVEIESRGSRVHDETFSRTWRARAWAAMAKWNAALADTQAALRLVEDIRTRTVPTDYMKRGYAERIQDLYHLAVECYERLGRHREAFMAAEHGRSRAFLDLLATRDAGDDSAPLPKLLDPAGEPMLRSALSAEPASFEQVVETTRRLNSTVLAYWVSPKVLYAWTVDQAGEVRSARLDTGAPALEQLVRGLWRAPESGDKRAWRELHRLLIQPVRGWLPESGGRRLTVIPHGRLHQVPFAGLLAPDGRYLAESFALHAVPCAALLTHTARRPKSGGAAALVIAPLANLPATQREAAIIAARMPAGSVRTLAGNAAVRDAVLTQVKGARVVHFATHGVAGEHRPFDSYLALASGGKLTAGDIYGLDLTADLVVLSACKTGLGQLSSDGILGLTRAFFYAGAPSVVASLWNVADEPAELLVGEFYRSMALGADRARALRDAQLQVLRRLRTGQVKAGALVLPEHPVFWASFVLQGEI